MLNEIKSPMVIFAERINRLYKNPSIYGKLPSYCQNLFPDYSTYKYYSSNNSADNIDKKYFNSPRLSIDYNKFKMKQINFLKTRNTKIKNEDAFIDFENNKFIENSNNTGQDFNIFKFKLEKKNPFKNKSQINIFSNEKIKSSSFIKNYFKKNSKNNPKPISNKLEILNNLYRNNSPFKKIIKNFDNNNYIKKWDSPKSIRFDKISGREDKRINIKVNNRIEGDKDYCPNYNSIFCDTSKSYINYSSDIKKYCKKFKSGITRKIICNYRKLLNNSSDTYNIFNVVMEEKKQENEEKIKRKRKIYGPLYDFLENNDNVKRILKKLKKKIIIKKNNVIE